MQSKKNILLSIHQHDNSFILYLLHYLIILICLCLLDLKFFIKKIAQMEEKSIFLFNNHFLTDIY